MKIDYSPRQSGKTTRMIEWLKEDLKNRFIVVGSEERLYHLTRQYPDCKEKIIHFSSLRETIFNPRDQQAGFDDAEYILERMLPGWASLRRISMSVEEDISK